MLIDWQKVVLNLRTAGCTTNAIIRRANMAGSTIRHLARGEIKEPRFSQGMKLLDMHSSFCPDKHSLNNLKLGGK